MDTAAVRLVRTSKRYGDLVAVDGVDLSIRRRELFTLLGPSGSGKTTILRMIAGLIHPTSGQIWLGQERVEERPPYERNIGMVFQSLALFPQMDVFANIAFPLRMRRISRREIAARVGRALEMVRLPDIAARSVGELSGGQQQRVALARALVYEPELLLLDEPLGALDRRLREEMQLEIVRLHQEVDVTIINVTHDQREALMLSDRIGVMRLGRLDQVGSSKDLYREPQTRFVAAFLGEANLLLGEAATDGERAWLQTATGARLEVRRPVGSLLGRQCALVVRAESLHLAVPSGSGSSEGRNEFPGRVAVKAFEGAAIYYEVNVPALRAMLKVLTPASVLIREFEADEEVLVGWDPASANVLGPEEQDERLVPPPADATG
ncbi:MAG TPA: ABC transporter ATP-binding protein [Actinomycetota bacterium]|nr:ABC transporter ATP-binding protein [Actinomycetota bacterium]